MKGLIFLEIMALMYKARDKKEGIYLDYAKKLIDKGEAYYCFCDQERLDSLRTTVSEDGIEITKYDKHCLYLSEEEIKKNLDEKTPYVIRQNTPEEGTTTFSDVVMGISQKILSLMI